MFSKTRAEESFKKHWGGRFSHETLHQVSDEIAEHALPDEILYYMEERNLIGEYMDKFFDYFCRLLDYPLGRKDVGFVIELDD